MSYMLDCPHVSLKRCALIPRNWLISIRRIRRKSFHPARTRPTRYQGAQIHIKFPIYLSIAWRSSSLLPKLHRSVLCNPIFRSINLSFPRRRAQARLLISSRKTWVVYFRRGGPSWDNLEGTGAVYHKRIRRRRTQLDGARTRNCLARIVVRVWRIQVDRVRTLKGSTKDDAPKDEWTGDGNGIYGNRVSREFTADWRHRISSETAMKFSCALPFSSALSRNARFVPSWTFADGDWMSDRILRA